MLHRRFASFVLASIASSLVVSSVAASPRAVIELFTSQGCSSCPAADKLAGELALDPSLIVLSLPIDYWDYLGWKDTLATPTNTMRQRAYAHERGDRKIYTPQMVINGVAHALGSDRAAIERAIAQSRRNAALLSLPVDVTASDGKMAVNVSVPAGETRSGEIWACGFKKSVPVEVGRGENRGRTITYHNVARRWVKLGEWTGKSQTLNVPVADLKRDGADSLAVFVQGGSRDKPGPMLGAAIADIP